MTKRDLINRALRFMPLPYVPWSVRLTKEAKDLLYNHFGPVDLEDQLQNHFIELGSDIGFFQEIGNERFKDVFGVVWDRTIDKDIGNVEIIVLPEPTLKNYTFPDPLDNRFFADIPGKIEIYGDRFRVFDIGFSLFERAWTMRGMENLMMDFLINPGFVHELLEAITDYNILQIRQAMKFDIDAVYFGDDWGQQNGLLMGYDIWKDFIAPLLKKMYDEVHRNGKFVLIHSCGDVDELFDDLIDLGVNCFNPFQPEVMNVEDLFLKYHGRLAFWGGLSTQRLLPYGSVKEIKDKTRNWIELGKRGGYIFSPAHAVEGDVPLKNILAFLEVLHEQIS